MRVWLALHFKNPRTLRKLGPRKIERVAELANVFLPPALRRSQVDVVSAPTGMIFQWQAKDAPILRPIGKHEGRVLTFSGHTTMPELASPDQVLRSLTLEAGKPSMPIAPGGMAAYALMHEDGVDAWSSNPAVESVFVAESNELVCLGSRPLAVHLVAKDITRPIMSVDYMRRILLRGFVASEFSPFEGTSYLPPRSRIQVRGREISLVGLPTYGDDPDAPSSTEDAVEQMLPELRATARALPQDRPTDLWLSGGKDSRLLAGLLVDQGVHAVARTIAPEGHGEDVVAKEIAQLCGIEYHLNTDLNHICTTGIRHRVASHLRESDGLVSEAHLTIWPPFAELGTTAEVRPFLLGHAHHLRGGYAKRMRYGDFAGYLAECFIEPRDLLSASAQEFGDSIVTSYTERTEVSHPIRWLYHAYDDYRAGRWLPSWYAGAAPYRPIHYPLCDERVVRLAAVIDSFSLVSERLQFGLIARLKPELSRVPLFEARWRFEATAASDLDPSGFEARTPITTGHAPNAGPVPWLALGSKGMGVTMTAQIRESGYWPLVQDILAPEMRALVERFEGQDVTTPKARMLWRLYCGSIAFDGDWL